METIKRQKIDERVWFTPEEKEQFAAKSDHKCCHCGKKAFFKYGATVEHFIPISKGGTNRDINMIMLCKDCNAHKDNFIYRPKDYLPYLKQEHLEKIQGYFDSYIMSFDFVNRDNLLACDRYKVLVNVMPDNLYYTVKERYKSKKKRDKFFEQHSIPYWVKRATFDDVDKLTEYFIKYLKKYDCLDDEASARINIEFWLTFGCIYYIERDNDIECFITVSVTKANNRVTIKNKKIDYFLTVNVFAYYSTSKSLTLVYNLSRQIPRIICDEQGLRQMPVKYSMLKNDTLSGEICDGGSIFEGGRFIHAFMVLYDCDKDTLPSITEDKALSDFFKRFNQLSRDKLDSWFNSHGTSSFDWMLEEIELSELSDEEEFDEVVEEDED